MLNTNPIINIVLPHIHSNNIGIYIEEAILEHFHL